jgi:hypothetical protein
MPNPLDKFIPEIEPAWMRPPLWRWLEASEFLANPLQPLMTASDETVRGAALFLRARAGRKGQPLAREYPAYHLAYKMWGMASQFGGLRWQLEALMLAGFSDQQLAQMLPMHSATTVYRIYRKLYFDVDDYRENQFAVLSNIFAQSYSRNYDDVDNDLTWKMLAYELRERFPLALRGIMGAQMPEDIEARIQDMTRTRLLYAQHHLVNSMRLQYNEQTLSLLTTAGQYWKLDQKRVGEIQDQRLASTCEKLLGSINLVIVDGHAKLPAIESLRQDVDTRALVEHFCVK